MRTMTMLDKTGDSTIAWDEDSDDAMRAFIAAKMAKGWSFFVLKPRSVPFLPPKRVKLRSLSDLDGDRAVSMSDAQFQDLIRAGIAAPAKAADAPLETERRAKTPEEALAANTVAVAPKAGG